MTRTRGSEKPIRIHIDGLLAELDGVSMRKDIQKFDQNGNKAAGTRIRVALSNVAKQCKEIRALVLERKG